MMNVLWPVLMLAAVICGAATGRMEAVTGALLSGAADAVALALTLLGVMSLWSGLMRVAERAGLTRALARQFAPLLRVLFPGLEPDSAAAQAICMNVAANLLGMGNAATPFGLAAMKELARRSPTPGVASNDMITFVVMNTACLQLLPSTIAALRQAAGSAAPFDITPCVWITSVVSLSVGLLTAWALRLPEHIRRGAAASRRSAHAPAG